MAHGDDRRPVNPNRERKSIGAEKTFTPATQDVEELHERLDQVLARLHRRIEERRLEGRSVTLKIKHADFSVHTRQHTLSHPTGRKSALRRLGRHLLHSPHPPREPVRLLGLSLSHLTERTGDTARQLWLPFDRLVDPSADDQARAA
jgi:DNA polymerase-4